MKKAAVTTTSEGDAERLGAVLAARQQFLNAAMNMGWQLALTVIVPVVVGVKLDDHFNSTPSYTLAALVIAVACACGVVWNTLKQVAAEQAKENKK